MTDKTVPVWVDNDGQKVQVGWATPDDGTGVRKINLLDGFDNAAIKNAKFGDIDPFTTDLDPAETQEPPRTFETDEDLPYIHDEDLENVDDDDSDETEDLPEGFEPAPAVQEEPTQDEDPAQP